MIELQDIRKTYHVGDVDLEVLKGISLDVSEGEYVALMGSSGSGKTTLMNLLGSLDYPTNGSYHMAGIDVESLSPDKLAEFRNQYIGFCFQNFNLLPRTSALDNVLLPTLYSRDERSRNERVEYARELLEIVGLGGRLDHTPNQLSGGERQRVAIARSLVNRPKLLLADEPTGNLDSHTEQEILEVFRKLNEEHGITLVVVTHDQAVAQHANRIVQMKDGIISEDTINGEPRTTIASEHNEETVELHRGRSLGFAATLNAVLIAVLALRRNALRTFLTMLGIIIGVASVVNVMELSSGASKAIEDTVASMGASMLTVHSSEGGHNRRTRHVSLTPADADRIKLHCDSVRHTSPLLHGSCQLVRGNRRWTPRSMGASEEYFPARSWNAELGQVFTAKHVQESSKVCVIGRTVSDALFKDKFPIGQEVRANNTLLRVVGVLEPKGGDVIGGDQDDIVIIPWTTFKYRLNQSRGHRTQIATYSDKLPAMSLGTFDRRIRDNSVHQIYIEAQSPQHVGETREQVEAALCAHYDVEPAAFQIHDLSEVSKVTRQVVAGLSALGFLIAAVSLSVGGVGIMNIMLVSVTERTREIGLRMALGANRRAIMRQFLIEATVLCVVGGLFGILIGHLGSSVVGYFMAWPTVLSYWAALIALGVAASVGIIFGYYPARKASMLNPIEALRFE